MLYVPRSRYRARPFTPLGYVVIFGLGVTIGPWLILGFIYSVFWSWQAAGHLIGQ